MNVKLKEIQAPVEDLLAETTIILKEKAKSNIPLIDNISAMTPIAKGKKIRSTLLFLLAGMNDTPTTGISEIAASIEMFHLSSLIHDDIMDNSEQRRGQKTLNTNIGNFRSVLWGDHLFINAFSSIHDLGKPQVLDIILEAARLMVEGQLIEVENAYNFDMNLGTYYDVINRKTSSLFSAVSSIVFAIKGHPSLNMEAFRDFGVKFGAIFQMRDDVMDIWSTKTGKDHFRDLEEGKVTLPFILLMKACEKDIRKDFLKGRKKKLLRLFEKYDIQARCMKTIDEFHQQCLDFLSNFPDSNYKETTLKLLDFIKHRDY